MTLREIENDIVAILKENSTKLRIQPSGVQHGKYAELMPTGGTIWVFAEPAISEIGQSGIPARVASIEVWVCASANTQWEAKFASIELAERCARLLKKYCLIKYELDYATASLAVIVLYYENSYQMVDV